MHSLWIYNTQVTEFHSSTCLHLYQFPSLDRQPIRDRIDISTMHLHDSLPIFSSPRTSYEPITLFKCSGPAAAFRFLHFVYSHFSSTSNWYITHRFPMPSLRYDVMISFTSTLPSVLIKTTNVITIWHNYIFTSLV